jgi:hypothetical protein
MRNVKENIFVSFLGLLQVQHTKDFSNQFFNEHPHKYNLFGLSKMLSDYGVKNAGIRIANKEADLPNIECPFVAHTGADFVVVYKVDAEKIHYLWNGKQITVTVKQFIKTWSGIILLAEVTSNSIELNYKEHWKKELFRVAQQSILALVYL